jgi:hypothetical protein
VLCVQLCPQSQTNYGEQGDSENPIIKFLLLGGILSTALLPTKNILIKNFSKSAKNLTNLEKTFFSAKIFLYLIARF